VEDTDSALGTAGKAPQFPAGLVVVLDLVGPARIRTFGDRLGAYGWREAGERINAALRRNAVRSQAFTLLKDTATFPHDRAGRYFPEVVAQDRARQESTLEVLAHEDPGGHRLAHVIDILAWITALGTLLFLVGRTSSRASTPYPVLEHRSDHHRGTAPEIHRAACLIFDAVPNPGARPQPGAVRSPASPCSEDHVPYGHTHSPVVCQPYKGQHARPGVVKEDVAKWPAEGRFVDRVACRSRRDPAKSLPVLRDRPPRTGWHGRSPTGRRWR
jgi:hypothetical protein